MSAYVRVCMWAHVVEATGDAGSDEAALWENDAVKELQLSLLHREGKFASTLGHFPCDKYS